jgi:glycosyltransferase involved in cell wall biosynthesis
LTDLGDSNLLVITDRYPHERDAVSSSFVKSQVDCLKKYVANINVIALTPFVPRLLSQFSFMNPRWRRDAFAQDYEYHNVSVFFARYFTLPFEFSRRRRGDEAFKVVEKIIRRRKMHFDLIHAHFTYPSGYVGAKLKEDYKKPVILTVHEDRDGFLKEIFSNNRNLIYTWNFVDKIIRVNEKDLMEFKRLQIDESKLMFLPNGYSQDLFFPMDSNNARIKLKLPLDKTILVNIASLEAYKGQKYLIEAMKKILVIRQDIMLYIVGQGSLENSLSLLINKYGLQDNVILAGGNKPREEIALWMNACDVFVLPSLSESFGIVQIEAMACGKPVVATRNGGSEEIVIDDRLGILVEPRDSEGLARAIFMVLNKGVDQNYILEYAKKFTWDRITNKLMSTYDEVLRKDLFGE